MATIKINDDAIWIKGIEGDPGLQERIRGLRPRQVLDLEVDGVVGQWERMRDGSDGRPTLGIKPIGKMREVWSRLRQSATQKVVPLREVVTADSYLTALPATLGEWDSKEDDEAYRDL
ncbi:MAG: hypothetical protein WDM94_13295 [Bauldia sp.]